jgi:hypothetical protein
METITLEQNDESYLITIDKKAIDKESLSRIIERIRIEYLIAQAGFDESIEELGEELKKDWWTRNQARILGKIDQADE